MRIASMEDVDFIAQQSGEKISLTVAAMTSLMNDTENKYTIMESQNWYQRMLKTCLGRNKATLAEIQQNHDKLISYMAEVITELFNRNCLDQMIMISLGTQINEMYSEQVGLKEALGAFAVKLNEKINSVDNFHMLTEEINQGIYNNGSALVSLCRIMSQFDLRILDDSRKIDILKRSMTAQGIIDDEPVLITDYLKQILELPIDSAGQIYLELGTIRNNFIANVILQLMDNYHFLPDLTRKMKSKASIINNVISSEGLDDSISLSSNDIFDDFVNSKLEVCPLSGTVTAEISRDDADENSFEEISSEEDDATELKEAEDLFARYQMEEAFELFSRLAEQGNARAMGFLGDLYVSGYPGIEENEEMARLWFERGRDYGDELSLYGLAELDEDEELYSEVFQPLLRLAENGDMFAQMKLYWMYWYGDGVEQNRKESIKWVTRSAEQGYWEALIELAEEYYSGRSIRRDYNKAYMLDLQAAEMGAERALYECGLYYYMGRSVKRDFLKAKEYFVKASNNGYGKAAFVLAVMYKCGLGVAENEKLKMQWFKTALRQGYYDAFYGCMEDIEDDEELLDEVEEGIGDVDENSDINKQAVWAFCQMGRYGLADERDEIDIDEIDITDTEAWRMINRAAEGGVLVANAVLAEMYADDDLVQENPEKVFQCMYRLANIGVPAAQRELGEYYYEGYGIDYDSEQARIWLRKVAVVNTAARTMLKNCFYEDIEDYEPRYGDFFDNDEDEKPMKRIKEICRSFREKHNDGVFCESPAIMDSDDVLMGHDESWLQIVAIGFRVTIEGIECSPQSMDESVEDYLVLCGEADTDDFLGEISYEQFANAKKIYRDGSFIYADDRLIAFNSFATEDEMEDLLKMFQDIASVVRKNME